MTTRYRFRGLLADVSVTAWVESNGQLRTFRDTLEARLPGTPQQRRQRAQHLTERFLIAALDDFLGHNVDRLSHHLDEIHRIRTEIKRRYDGLANLDPTAPSLPQDLDPTRLTALFNDLETHLRALEDGSPSQRLADDAEIPTDRIDAVSDQVQREISPSRTGEQERAPEVEPDLPLQRRRTAERQEEVQRLRREDPSITSERAARAAVRRQERLPPPPVRDRAMRSLWNDMKRLFPEDQNLRAALMLRAQAFAALLPPGWRVSLQRTGPHNRALAEQLTALRDIDRWFLAHGYELILMPPNGRRFRPDGIRFVGGGNRFLFLEHKSKAFYDDTTNLDALRERLYTEMVDDAERAAFFRDHGCPCQGFMYTTRGDPTLDGIIASLIVEVETNNPGLRGLLHMGLIE